MYAADRGATRGEQRLQAAIAVATRSAVSAAATLGDANLGRRRRAAGSK